MPYTNGFPTTLASPVRIVGASGLLFDIHQAPDASYSLGSWDFTGDSAYLLSSLSFSFGTATQGTSNVYTFQSSGLYLSGTLVPLFDANGNVNATTLQINSNTIFDASAYLYLKMATPANSGVSGVAGQTSWDSNYIYVCTAPNTWKRVALSSF